MDSNVPIAIVGMSCRFAGDVDDPEKLWRLVAEGRSAWSEIPTSRFNVEGFFHPNFEKLNGTNVIGGHFLSEEVGLFDANFFNLSAETAAALDPQFRLQLESTYEAFESAGVTLQDVAGSNTSVYAGSFFRDYHESLIRDPDTLPRFLLMGTGSAMASNRLSHFFDLRGPSMSVDTGCSTTLTALHQGCQSLRTGESDMSVVGGANVMFNPDMFLAMSSMTLISKDGKSYAFDSRANGYGRGEGSASLVLKRLDDALRDGNPIRAVIRETGVNQDGRTETITTPSGKAQEELIRACYKRAGLDPALTTYFEAHGTGTPTGDPIEVKAIASVFGKSRPADEPLRIGSVKTNIGHTETASGVAAVIKVVKALEEGKIPPSINFKKPNEKLHLDEWRLKVPTELESWAGKDGIRRASINNFGYGGSNAHVIIEDLSSYLKSRSKKPACDSGVYLNGAKPDCLTNGQTNGAANGHTNGHINGSNSGASNGHRLSISSEVGDVFQSRVFVLSGKDERATEAMVANLRDYLLRVNPDDANKFLDDLAYTLCHRRSRFSWLTTVHGGNIDDLLKTLDSGKARPVKAGARPRLGFVYTGQGAQWWAMGRELIDAYPVFKTALMDCDAELKKLGITWNMIEELGRDAETTRVNELDYSTPVCVAVQIALTHLLRSWDIIPTAVTSHSSGEIAAAYAAGALDLPSAMAIVFARGGLASDMNRQLVRKGGMVAVGLGVESSKKYLSGITNGQVIVACENSPSSITVSGDVLGLDQLEAVLKRENIFARRLKVDAAWHSHHMEAVADAYYASMDNKVRPAQDHLDFIFSSPSTGTRIESVEEIGSPGHWVHSLTGPVKFVDAFRNMCFDNSSTGEPVVDMVIEVGPHAALSGPIQDIMGLPEFKGTNIPYASCLIRKQNAVASMQTLVGSLLQKGYPVNLAPVNFPLGLDGMKVLHDLPKYPWNHQTRHWNEPRINKAHRHRIDNHHDLLGSLVPGTNLEAPTWRHIVRLSDLPWVRDHVVQNNMVYPAAGYIAMAIEGMSFLSSYKHPDRKVTGYELRDVDILNALLVPESSEGIEVQLQLRPCKDKDISTHGWTEFQVQSVSAENKWTDHCKGIILVQHAAADGTAPAQVVQQHRGLLQRRSESDFRVHIKPDDVYAELRASGISHGPIFRNMVDVRARNKQSIATFSVVDSAATMPNRYQHQHLIHPITLDSVFQAVYTAIPGAGSKTDAPRVPRSISRLWVAGNVSAEPGHSFKTYVDLDHVDDQTLTASLTVVNGSPSSYNAPEPVITLNNFLYQSIGKAPAASTVAWEKEKFATMKWAPDITFIKQSFFRKQLGSDLSAEEAETIMDLRKACLLYIHDALRELAADDVKRLEWYHKKFYIWMKLQVQLASTDELAPNSSTWADIAGEEKTEILDRVRADSTNGEMVCKLGPHIASILRGEITALELMLEKSLLSRYYLDGLKWGRANEKLGEVVRHYAHKHPRAKIIEIGGGTGGATRHVLNALGTKQSGNGPAAASYDFTDVSSGFFEAAKEKFDDWKDLMRFKKLDIEQDPSKQGFEEGTYDVVIACQVLHATKSMHSTMSNVRKLLKPGGKLFIMETTQDQLDIQFVFGFLPGWWLSEEEDRKFSPSLTVPMWDRVLHQTGFRGVETEVRDCEDDELYSFSVISSTASQPSPKFDFDVSFVVADDVPDTWIDKLRVSVGLLTCTVPANQTLEEASFDGNRVCIFVDSPTNPILANATPDQFEGLKKMCAASKGLLWLSRGGSEACNDPLASLAAGFLRSVRQEYSEKRLGTLDIDPLQPLWSNESIQTVTEVFRTLFDLSASPESLDFEFADRGGVIQVPRYIKDSERNSSIFYDTVSHPTPQLEPFLQPDRPLRLTIGTTGLLDTLAFDDDLSANQRLPEDFVEIEPRAFGVNFRDVMTAMGQLRSRVMGYDCAGTIIRAGPVAAANGHKKGDRVSVLLRGHYGSRVRVHWSSAVQIPDSMSMEVAASLPTQYVTAYLSLYDTARIQQGEKILIHSATGGVGQAAVMLSQRVGAEVFVTVGSQEKRNLVMTRFGIPPDHIFSSRDTSFASGILTMTGGKGVDVVLNSLAGNLLQESFNCLAPFGRFVELGKRDFELNHSLAMEAFTRAVSFTSIDLIAFGTQKPAHANRILKDVVRLVTDGEVNAVHPISVYPISDVEKAFRLMQAGKHMGKIVLSVTPDVKVPVLPPASTTKLRSDSAYMVVGGFGGIGRSICRWLAEQGAEHLVVVSRSATNTEKMLKLQSELDHIPHQVEISTIGCDISDAAQLKEELDRYAATTAPAIRGIIHGGMELRDSVLERMTLEEHKAALGPKVRGSWNLHQHFSSAGDLDFYIMLSSLIGIVGFASQSNYSAGGAYQDALARHRVHAGLPAVSIDLGIVKSVGYLAGSGSEKTIEALQRHGFTALSEGDILAAIDSAINTPFAGQLTLGLNTGPAAQNDGSPLARDMRFSALKYQETGSDTPAKVPGSGAGDLAASIADASSLEEAVTVIVAGIAKKLMDIFIIPEDEVLSTRSPADFGVDSLVAVELRNMLALKAGAELSIFDIMQSPSLTALATTVAGKCSYIDPSLLST